MKDSFDMINSRSKPLAAYIFTSDEELKKDFVRDISAGGMLINDTILHVNCKLCPLIYSENIYSASSEITSTSIKSYQVHN